MWHPWLLEALAAVEAQSLQTSCRRLAEASGADHAIGT